MNKNEKRRLLVVLERFIFILALAYIVVPSFRQLFGSLSIYLGLFLAIAWIFLGALREGMKDE